MASLVELVGENNLPGIEHYLQKVHKEMGKAALLNEITTCEHEGRNAKSAIHRAAMRGRAQIIQRFLKEEIPIDVLDDQGNTPLHLATDLGRSRAAKCLLEAGASAEIRNCFGRTAKDMSTANSWDAQETADGKAFIRRMLAGEKIPMANLPPEPPSGIEALARRAPAPPKKLPDESEMAVAELEQEVAAEIPKLLPQKDQPPRTDEEEVSYDNMSDFDFGTKVDLKALVRQSDEVAVKRWLRCVALKSVHEYLWPNLPLQTGLTALIGSCEHGDAGEDTRVALSALHIAALRGNVNVMRMLLETRINPNMTNDQGSTPLHFAVDVDRPECAQLLLKYKANPYQRNNFGRTPYEMRDGRGQHVAPHHTDRMVTIVFCLTMKGSDKECSICQEEFRAGEVLRVTPCLHKFHAFCIDEWLSKSYKANCPVCNHCIDQREIPEISEEINPVLSWTGGYIGV